jgi:hypothetical protein
MEGFTLIDPSHGVTPWLLRGFMGWINDPLLAKEGFGANNWGKWEPWVTLVNN